MYSTSYSYLSLLQSNDNHQRELFEREVVKQQLRSLQVLETLHLMAAGRTSGDHRHNCVNV